MNTVELLKNLSETRKKIEEIAERKSKMIKEVQETEDYKSLNSFLIQLNHIEEDLTVRIKQEVLDEYKNSGNKKPIPGCEVQMFTVLKYDEKEAEKWAFNNLRMVLKLDKKEFEKIAKSGNIEIVTIIQEPRVKIASDIDKVLGEK